MDRTEALRRIPRAYSLALRLRDAGVCDELIAECVGVEIEALGPLYLVAEAKLAAIIAEAAAVGTGLGQPRQVVPGDAARS